MDLFEAYTRETLAYRLDGTAEDYPTAPLPQAPLDTVLRQAARAGHLVLLGAGQGEAARTAAQHLPEGVGLTVCELCPERARAYNGPGRLLADTSETALAWMLFSLGLIPGRAVCALNPEVADSAANARLRTLKRLHAAFSPLALGACAQPGVTLGIMAILHPDEPGLDDFFASLPACALEAVVVWDAGQPPASPPSAPMQVRHLAHPLDADFAAQRNRALEASRTDWVLYLDADERLDPALALALPALTAQNTTAAFAFERRALGPNGVKVGFGLWPDLQLRLFRRAPGVRFVRPVHERLEGITGPTGLGLGPGIRHLCDTLKSTRSIDGKLALFDRAAGQGTLHRRNADHPTLPETLFTPRSERLVTGLWPESIRFLPL